MTKQEQPDKSAAKQSLTCSTLISKFFRAATRLGCTVEYVFEREVTDGIPFAIPSNVEIRILRDNDLLALEHQKMTTLDATTLNAAKIRGDFCAAAFVEGKVVAYTWNTNVSVPYNAALEVRVPAGYAYGYGAFTDSRYRGFNLYPELIRRIAVESRSSGQSHRVAYVSAGNRPSLRGIMKLGYIIVGWLLVIGKRPPFKIIRSRAVKALGFNLAPKR